MGKPRTRINRECNDYSQLLFVLHCSFTSLDPSSSSGLWPPIWKPQQIRRPWPTHCFPALFFFLLSHISFGCGQWGLQTLEQGTLLQEHIRLSNYPYSSSIQKVFLDSYWFWQCRGSTSEHRIWNNNGSVGQACCQWRRRQCQRSRGAGTVSVTTLVFVGFDEI